ncbi:MAG: hypothetical protein ACHBNF_22840 [Chromatiales bacterium]
MPIYGVIYRNVSFNLSGEKVLGAVLTLVVLGVPVSSGAQAIAAEQLTGKLVITGSSTIAPLT